MQDVKHRTGIFISALICGILLFFTQNTIAIPISGFGDPLSDSALAGGSVIDFEANVNGESAVSFDYTDVSLSGNNTLRITDSYSGSFNVTGNAMALTSNDRTQEIFFTFLSPVDAFGFNFGGADYEWQLTAYSQSNTILDDLSISPFGGSNSGEWFGIATPGIALVRLYNTTFDIISNTGTLDYVVIDNVAYSSAVPEPSTFMLLGLGLSGVCMYRRRVHNKAV